jgi:hypothetical protein
MSAAQQCEVSAQRLRAEYSSIYAHRTRIALDGKCYVLAFMREGGTEFQVLHGGDGKALAVLAPAQNRGSILAAGKPNPATDARDAAAFIEEHMGRK